MIYKYKRSGLPELDKMACDEKVNDWGSVEQCFLDCQSECNGLWRPSQLEERFQSSQSVN